MKTEKKQNAKKIAAIAVAVVVAVLAVTLMAVFLPKTAADRAASAKETEASSIKRIMLDIDALEEEYQKSFDEHAALWEKYFAELQTLDELPEDFDEIAFINALTTLTDEEKAMLVKNVETLDELDAKLEKLYEELFELDEKEFDNECSDGACDFAEREEEYFADEYEYDEYDYDYDYDYDYEYDEDMLFIEDDEAFFGDNFDKAYDEAEQRHEQIQSLKKSFDELVNSRAELWDKVYASYDELDENFDYASFDEATYIAGLSVLSAEEKEILLGDLAKLDEIADKLYEVCGANCGIR